MNSLSNPITTQLGDQGLGQQPWWVEQWMELINGYRFKKRLERAWEYARSGNVPRSASRAAGCMPECRAAARSPTR